MSPVTLWFRHGRDDRDVATWIRARCGLDAPTFHWLEPTPEARLAEDDSRLPDFRGVGRGAPPETLPALDEARLFFTAGAAHAVVDDAGRGCRWAEFVEGDAPPTTDGWTAVTVTARDERVLLRRDLKRFGLPEGSFGGAVRVRAYHARHGLRAWRITAMEAT